MVNNQNQKLKPKPQLRRGEEEDLKGQKIKNKGKFYDELFVSSFIKKIRRRYRDC